jgi:23S rRNA-/tRNA-specific pseudouridylate synthase
MQYIKFKHRVTNPHKTLSPLKELLKDTKKQALISLKESHDLPQRLSKCLSDLGLFSRHYAEELIKAGVFFVDNKRVHDPTIIVGQDANFSFNLNKHVLFPLPLNVKLWLYHKHSGCIITKDSDDVSS